MSAANGAAADGRVADGLSVREFVERAADQIDALVRNRSQPSLWDRGYDRGVVDARRELIGLMILLLPGDGSV